MREALGIDIGGLIIARAAVRGDASFSAENDLETPEVGGAVDAIKRLVDDRFGRRVFSRVKMRPAPAVPRARGRRS